MILEIAYTYILYTILHDFKCNVAIKFIAFIIIYIISAFLNVAIALTRGHVGQT